MSNESVPRHEWPEEEPQAEEVPPRKRGRLARLIEGPGLTIGSAQGLAGGRSGDGSRAMTNHIAADEMRRRTKE